eukprot:5608032-Prymnesium_polylepis.5
MLKGKAKIGDSKKPGSFGEARSSCPTSCSACCADCVRDGRWLAVARTKRRLSSYRRNSSASLSVESSLGSTGCDKQPLTKAEVIETTRRALHRTTHSHNTGKATDIFYTSYLSVRAHSITEFMGHAQPKWRLPITSVVISAATPT